MKPMEQKIVTIIGGTGFLGRYTAQALAHAGYRLRVVSRHPHLAAEIQTYGDPGQVALIPGDLNDVPSLVPIIKDSYAVIDLVGVLFERGKQNFAALHAVASEKLAAAAKESGVKRFVFVSALGVDSDCASSYSRSKLMGERAVLAAFPEATIIRPSIMFGAEDNFFNKFAKMAMFAPALPLIGGGKTLFQPVYVGDVSRAIATCIDKPETCGEIYELGGRKIWSFKEILQYILQVSGRRRLLIPLPFWLASILGSILEWLPIPQLTRDQVRLLKCDNVVNEKAKTLSWLGIPPTAVEDVVPKYLAKFSKKKVEVGK